MNAKDAKTLESSLYGVIGAIVDIEELRLKSTSEKDEIEINNFVLSVHDSITTLARTFKINL